ncbi:hypothetical protein AYO20_11167 [Fonsecaea nubica]|uniref:SUI1 domain-containing protein n=1 Tax=Fonsecaea nubica TaxID=856822 RepID=A0A178BYE9_9EURO|nr:hypothetical protein AYO20_11167 [Fonsecaea nubica]OAL22679.1 hypothetical protein AYO20_11167 [Fonsecaea nubica]
MSAKKDMRRADLVIPYVEPKDEKPTDFSSTITSTMPMAAMFTRNRMLGWFSLLTALLNWLGETPAQRQSPNGTPAYMSFGMAALSTDSYVPDIYAPVSTATAKRKRTTSASTRRFNIAIGPSSIGGFHGKNGREILPFLETNEFMSTIQNLKTFGKPTPLLTPSRHLAADAHRPNNSPLSCASTAPDFGSDCLRAWLKPAVDYHDPYPFAEADDDTGEAKQSQNYIHIRIQQRNGRKTLTTVQGLPKKFDQKKILKVIKKKFACNGTIVTDSEMGEVIQLQGDQRKDVQEFLVAKDGLELDAKTIKGPPSYGDAFVPRNGSLRYAATDPTNPSRSPPTAQPGPAPGGVVVENANIASVAMSARYPRVAVLLGVQPRWHVPLLLCRALSTVSAAWWACQTCFSIYRLISVYGTTGATAASSTSLLSAGGSGGTSVGGGGSAGPGPGGSLLENRIFRRMAVAQVCLSFLWAGAAAYLAHMFASSLMSRWLLHYSPLAVLVRLCSLSILLSFGCLQIFRATQATEPDLLQLSRSLLAWIAISIGLMLAYFCTQQDIFSADHDDRDDRRRRQILRLKCLYVISACSLFSLLVLVGIVQLDHDTGMSLKGMIAAAIGSASEGGDGSAGRGWGLARPLHDWLVTCKALASDLSQQWRRFASGAARFGAEL